MMSIPVGIIMSIPHHDVDSSGHHHDPDAHHDIPNN